MLVSVWGTTFFGLDRSGPAAGRERSAIRPSVCLCSRIPSIRFGVRTSADFLIVRFSWPLSRVSEDVPRSAADGLFALIEVLAREPGLSCSERWRVAACLAAAETDGALRKESPGLLAMKLPMRERDSLLPVWVRLLEMRDPIDELRVCDLEVPAWPAAAMPDFATVGADGLVVPMEVPICLPELAFVELECVPVPLLKLDTEGVRAVIELPMRDVRPRLIRLFELLLDTDEDGFFVPIELPMREVLLELMRVLELLPVELLVLTELEDGLRVLKEVDGREVVIRLDGALLELLPDIVVLDPDVVGVLVVDILLELGVRSELLRAAALPRLKVLDLAGGFAERELVTRLLPLRVDMTLLGLRLDVIVRERLAVGVLLVDILLELVLRNELLRGAALLRLELLDRLGVRTERELTLLRLLLELADVLDLGAGADLAAGWLF
ncbi:MAG: hypothetical protein ACYTAO_02290 [Planctomycetota bacterium]